MKLPVSNNDQCKIKFEWNRVISSNMSSVVSTPKFFLLSIDQNDFYVFDITTRDFLVEVDET